MLRKLIQAAFAAVMMCAGAADAAPPFEAYGHMPSLDMVKLSPDGSTIAYVRAGDVKRWIVVQKLGNPKPIATMDVGDQKLRWIDWADNAHIIITTSSFAAVKGLGGKRHEHFVPQVLDLANGTQYNLFEKGIKGARYVMLNVAVGGNTTRIINGHTMVYSPAVYIPDPNRPVSQIGLFRVDLTDGDIKLVSRPSDIAPVQNWILDEAGNPVAVEQYYEDEGLWRLVIYGKGRPDIRIDFNAPTDQPGIAGFSEDGKSLIMRLPEDVSEKPLYESVSLETGNRTPWRRDQEILGIITDDYTDRVVGGDHSIEKTDYIWFEPTRDAVWQSVKAAFKTATDVSLESWSDDRTKVVLKVFGTTYGDGYFFIDMKAHTAFPIAPEYDQINQISEEKWIEYKAADGRVIHAYLTLPMGRDPKNLPLIVFPHGGPMARDEPGFDFFSQGLASLGYAVLQPEFRGSAGFGKDLLWAGFGEMGKKMQTDLSDGVRALAAQGLIDPKRVCIGGWSYGGYAALAGAALDPGVYRCAISGAGVSDTRKNLEYWRAGNPREDSNQRYWKRFLGVTDLSDSKIDAINPVNHASKITIPVLLIHGREDTTVPYEQSVFMANAMDSAGKKYEFVKLDGEDHHLSRSKSRLEAMKAMRDFLLKYNPPN